MTPWTILGWMAVAVASIILVAVPIAAFFILREYRRANERMRATDEWIEERRHRIEQGARRRR